MWCLAVLSGLAGAQAVQASGPIVQVTADGTSSVRPAWSPDGTHIAFQTSKDNTYKVMVMAADGSDRRMLTQGPADDRHPAWSADSKFLAVDTGTELKRDIAVVDVASGARSEVTHTDAFATFPAWSPDGKKLTYYLYQNGNLDIWAIDIDGSHAVQLTHTLASEAKNQCTFACHAATWSPDGLRVAYADGDQRQVYTMRSDDGTDSVKVSHDDPTGRSHFPLYLSDGRLVYVTEHINPGQSWTDIWARTPAASDPPTALLQEVQVQGPFDFSPDGHQLLFSSPRNGNFDIYVATLDDNGKEALKRPSADTDLAPALAAAGHPGGLSTSGSATTTPQSNTGPAGSTTVTGAQPIAAPSTAANTPSFPPAGFTPYIVALGGLALLWAGVEGVMIARKRTKRRGTQTHGH
ncbi:MAG: hypothetical protein NVSMB2_00040 [Chloroflexota bacterium]